MLDASALNYRRCLLPSTTVHKSQICTGQLVAGLVRTHCSPAADLAAKAEFTFLTC